MNPASVANVQNYAVRASSAHTVSIGSYLANLSGHIEGTASATEFFPKSVPLRAAVYDPATNSVTLIPKRRLNADLITVTQGSGSKKSSRRGHPTDAPLGLTDVEGNPINGDSTPGKFGVSVTGEAQSASSTTTTVNGVG